VIRPGAASPSAFAASSRSSRFGQEDVVLGEHEIGGRRPVALVAPQRHDLDFRGKGGRDLAQPASDVLGALQRDLDQLRSGAGRGLDPGFQDPVPQEEGQDGPGHAEGVGDRVAHGGVVVA
jgi:hypothetical protein